jgi:dolichol-phosphate mannosyltransferase
MKVSIISYLYNEQEIVHDLVLALRGFDAELIFVDDGSTDKTGYFLAKEGVRVVRNEKNRGVGGALKTGFTASSGDIIVTYPGEMAFDAKEIPNLINLLGDEADMVIGSYHHPKGKIEKISFLRIILSKVSTFLYNLILKRRGVKLYTVSSGFRAYKRKVIESVDLKAEDFLANSEIMVKAVLLGFKVKEYPVILRSRKKGTSSHMKILKTIMSHLKFQIKCLFTSKKL